MIVKVIEQYVEFLMWRDSGAAPENVEFGTFAIDDFEEDDKKYIWIKSSCFLASDAIDLIEAQATKHPVKITNIDLTESDEHQSMNFFSFWITVPADYWDAFGAEESE